MKQMQCEICGCSNLLKHDGLFVCQECGAKYSPDEARKLMCDGAPGTNNSQIVSNYMELAKSASEANNNAEAESYCNKILELDPANYEAWLLKGEAAAWQSTLDDLRFEEGVYCFSKAVENAPEENKREFFNFALDQIKELSMAIISLHGKRFSQCPDIDECKHTISSLQMIARVANNFLSLGMPMETKESQEEAPTELAVNAILAPLAEQIDTAVANAINNVIWPDYFDYSDGHPNVVQWKRYVKRNDACIELLRQTIKICTGDTQKNIDRYLNMTQLQNLVIASASWTYDTSTWGGGWREDYSLTSDAKAVRNGFIREYQDSINKLTNKLKQEEQERKRREEEQRRQKEAEAKLRIAEYWAAHADEKAELDAELKDLTEQIASLQADREQQVAALKNRIAALPENAVIADYEKKIAGIKTQLEALGFFKLKEKKTLQAQIDQLTKDKAPAEQKLHKAQAEIENEITAINGKFNALIRPLKDRADQITAEFTRAR